MKKPTQGLLAGIAISTLTLAGGALAKRYFEGLADRHEAQAIQVHKQNDACWNKMWPTPRRIRSRPVGSL